MATNNSDKNKEKLDQLRKKNFSPAQALLGGTIEKLTKEEDIEKQDIEKQDIDKHDNMNQTNSLDTQTVQENGRFGALKTKLKKQRVEDTHTRATFLVRNDLLKRLDKVSKRKHGFKIEFINLAIEMGLQEVEKELETKE